MMTKKKKIQRIALLNKHNNNYTFVEMQFESRKKREQNVAYLVGGQKEAVTGDDFLYRKILQEGRKAIKFL